MVIGFIGEKYGAKNLFYVPHKVAGEIFKRPNNSLRAVKKHCEPELGFQARMNTDFQQKETETTKQL